MYQLYNINPVKNQGLKNRLIASYNEAVAKYRENFQHYNTVIFYKKICYLNNSKL